VRWVTPQHGVEVCMRRILRSKARALRFSDVDSLMWRRRGVEGMVAENGARCYVIDNSSAWRMIRTCR